MTPFVKRKEKTKAPEKPPYATAPKSRWIPSDDPKPRVNVDYWKPPKQLVEKRKRKRL